MTRVMMLPSGLVLVGGVKFLQILASREDKTYQIDWVNTCDVTSPIGVVENATALHLAASFRSTDTITFLLDEGLATNLEVASAAGYTPMHFSAAHGAVDMIRFLHDKGATVNCRAEDGSLPLHWAVRVGETEAAEVLLSLGSEHTPDEKGLKPLSYALQRRNEDLIGCLRRALHVEESSSQGGSQTGDGTVWKYSKVLAGELEVALTEKSLEACLEARRQGCPGHRPTLVPWVLTVIARLEKLMG